MGRGTQGASSTLIIIHSRAGGSRARDKAVKEGRDRGQGRRKKRQEGGQSRGNEGAAAFMGYKVWETPATPTVDLAMGGLWALGQQFPRTVMS